MLLGMMDTRVKPAYDNLEWRRSPASLRLRKLRRRFARYLPESMGKSRKTGIAEVGSELLDRDVGVDRQFFDRGRDARALAPALEAQLRLR
jgi:hypothetical protein